MHHAGNRLLLQDWNEVGDQKNSTMSKIENAHEAMIETCILNMLLLN